MCVKNENQAPQLFDFAWWFFFVNFQQSVSKNEEDDDDNREVDKEEEGEVEFLFHQRVSKYRGDDHTTTFNSPFFKMVELWWKILFFCVVFFSVAFSICFYLSFTHTLTSSLTLAHSFFILFFSLSLQRFELRDLCLLLCHSTQLYRWWV